MMQAIHNEQEWAKRKYEQERKYREIEIQLEMQRCIYTVPSYRIEFSSMLPEDKVIVMDNVIHIPESQAYKWIFFNNHVTDETVRFAIDHAIRKVHRFIDNMKV